MLPNKNIAIIYPSGKLQMTPAETLKRIQQAELLGFDVFNLEPIQESEDGFTAAPVLERATSLSHALTSRKYSLLMAARGGAGSTELLPFLECMLPPVLPDKTLVGYSDVSFLGVYLAARFPNLRYVHGPSFFSPHIFKNESRQEKALLDILEFKPRTDNFPINACFPSMLKTVDAQIIHGHCIPLNLSLAESLATLKDFFLPEENILFLEECHEPLFRLIRKIDSLMNGNFLENTKAIVLGEFSDCTNNNQEPLDRLFLSQLVANKTRLPIIDWPLFGHKENNFPLVMNSKVTINLETQDLTLHHSFCPQTNVILPKITNPHNNFPSLKRPHHDIKVHMTGIGGTGMAQVAGFFVEDNYQVSGSDTPIYPPMDKIISQLNIKPHVGYRKETIEAEKPDFIVMANVVSRKSASLEENKELEEILAHKIPIFSFPSALRHFFLSKSCNVIIAGTHGKTTTSTLVTYLFEQLGHEPSFLVGGSPGNFKSGFSLRNRDLFILEGDEYDSAFFDKGPKFLHYQPKITLINNIEYDHADIYPNIDAIEAEFMRLAELTKKQNGYIIANIDDPRVQKIAKETKGNIIGFSCNFSTESLFPSWTLKKHITKETGSIISGITPWNTPFEFFLEVFGHHNALNAIASLAILQAYMLISEGKIKDHNLFLSKIISAMKGFKGVKRRFELLVRAHGISVFDDFAHHPTAIKTTLKAFRDYIDVCKFPGQLIVCFDPRNATMRRNVLQNELTKSFAEADIFYLGKVPQDLRMDSKEQLNGKEVVEPYEKKGRYFENNDELLAHLQNTVQDGDTVVFMSSGSFDGIPHKFADFVKNKL